jgi:hypothetical protein
MPPIFLYKFNSELFELRNIWHICATGALNVGRKAIRFRVNL